jgi:anti-sigma factor RsiW
MNGLSRKSMDDCTRLSHSIAPYIDGELDAGHAVDLEAHVLGCTPCAERVALLRSIRVSLKRTASSRASDALRARVAAAIGREQRRAELKLDAEESLKPKLIQLRYAVGLAAAAGVVFAMGMARHRQHNQDAMNIGSRHTMTADATSSADFERMIEDLVSLHADPLPPETTNPDELKRWDPLVGVPVRRPTFQPFGGSFHGARVHANADRRAALLHYTVLGGHRVTVYVFNPRSLPVQASRLSPRLVRERPVYVGHVRGYSVAAAEQRGVGYAVASDLDDDKSTQMVLAAFQQ